MAKYQYSKAALQVLERSVIPFAVYQRVDGQIVPLVISAGFCNLYGIAKEEAYELMSHNMYRDIHPDDKDRLIAAVSRFATEDVGLKVVYRIKTAKRKDYMVVHIQGEHFIAEDGERLAIVWYTSEGFYSSDDEGESALARSFNVMLREETMIRKTSYDALTGLPTMANFFKLVETARANTQEKDTKKAIVYFDFCGMTAYNSKYGYAEGDRLIRSLSGLLARYFGNENCSRFSQDNFAAYTNANDLEATLKKLFKECLDLNGGKTLPVRAGIYVDDEDGVEIGVACDRARMACNVNQRTLVSVYSA